MQLLRNGAMVICYSCRELADENFWVLRTFLVHQQTDLLGCTNECPSLSYLLFSLHIGWGWIGVILCIINWGAFKVQSYRSDYSVSALLWLGQTLILQLEDVVLTCPRRYTGTVPWDKLCVIYGSVYGALAHKFISWSMGWAMFACDWLFRRYHPGKSIILLIFSR